jgi:Putative Na+/H+ antiporter
VNFGITTGKDFIAICFALLLVSGGHAMAVVAPPEVAFPVPIDSYQDEQIHSLPAKLLNRIQREPFNLVAAVIFVFAIVHTFLVSKFRTIAHRLQHRYEDLEPLETGQRDDPYTIRRDRLLFGAQFFHFMGEVEAVFGIWLVPLFVAIIFFHGWSAMVQYVGHLNPTEAVFVVVIMTMASSRPILYLSELIIGYPARLGRNSPFAWWFSILTVGPLLGSLITEPAAMTICALLLRHKFYNTKPSESLKYATLGLLFVNISVGGTLTHFAAPPVIMVATRWHWHLTHMFWSFGWKAAIGILLSNLIYLLFFRKELIRLQAPKSESWPSDGIRPGVGLSFCHALFLTWSVAVSHYPTLVVLGFLFFLAFVSATQRYQQTVVLRPALLVGFFLVSLVIHGGCQEWWIVPLLGSLSEWPLMIGAVVLGAFNDNAAITYLASLVPNLSDPLKYAVVAGALTGGGLTVIANAPNPAGQSILASRFGESGISAIKLLAGAFVPTLIVGTMFMLFR